jgi:hypothetical protein
MEGGDMRGGGLRKRGLFFKVLLDLLVESLSYVVGKDQYGGHQFVGGFGHGGQDIHMVSWS